MAKSLQVNFKLTITADEWRATADALTPAFAAVPGLICKVWNHNEQSGEVAGFYFFTDEQALQQFAASDLANKVKTSPAVSELSMKVYDVMEGPTCGTRGAAVLDAAVSA